MPAEFRHDGRNLTMTRFCRRVLGLAAVALVTTVAGEGQSAANSTTKPRVGVNGPEYAPLEGTPLGQINVRQNDLLQTTIKNNWVSYNGDYTGRRFSSLSQVTPQNVSHLAAMWVFHTRNAGVLEVTPVV